MEATDVRPALACHSCGHRCLPPTPVAAVGGSLGARLNGRASPVEPGGATVGNTVRSELTVEPDTVAAELLHELLHHMAKKYTYFGPPTPRSRLPRWRGPA